MSKKSTKNKQDFLLTFFDNEPKYEFKEINGFILQKSLNGGNQKWEVSIFTKESFGNMNQKYCQDPNQKSLI